MEKIKLVIGDAEFPVNYEFLKMIAHNLPPLDTYKDLAKRIAAMNIPYLIEDIIEKDLLDVEDMDALWEENNIHIRRELTRNTTFLSKLTDGQAKQIIDLKDRAMLANVAENAEYIVPEGFLSEDARLSEEMSAKLMENLRAAPYGDVQDKLDFNWALPLKYRLPLAEHIKNGLEPWNMRLEDADENIMDVLRYAPYGYILRFATHLHDVENNIARDSVGEFLVNHPDPYIRLTLANNEHAPKEILQKLLYDSDADARERARESLEENEKDTGASGKM